MRRLFGFDVADRRGDWTSIGGSQITVTRTKGGDVRMTLIDVQGCERVVLDLTAKQAEAVANGIAAKVAAPTTGGRDDHGSEAGDA